jgi:hypothetical protein
MFGFKAEDSIGSKYPSQVLSTRCQAISQSALRATLFMLVCQRANQAFTELFLAINTATHIDVASCQKQSGSRLICLGSPDINVYHALHSHFATLSILVHVPRDRDSILDQYKTLG